MIKALAFASLALVAACKGEGKKAEPAPAPAPAPAPPDEDTTSMPDPRGVIDDVNIPPPPRPPSVTDAHMAARQTLVDYTIAAQKVITAHSGDCEKSGIALAAVNQDMSNKVLAAERVLAPLASDAAATAFMKYSLDGQRAYRANEVVALLAMCPGHQGVRDAVSTFALKSGLGPISGPAVEGPTWTGARPPGVTDEMIASIDALAAWNEEMARIAEGATGDCKKMAAGFAPLVKKSDELGKRTRTAQAGIASKSPEDEWLSQYTAQKVDMKRMILALGECMSDPAVMKTLEGTAK
jgi:hypothetical protein